MRYYTKPATMNTITTLNDHPKRGKIELASQASTKVALLFLVIFACSGTVATYFVFEWNGLGLTFVTTLAFFLIGLGLITRMIWKSIATAYIKGEMLIVRYLSGQLRITELRAIQATRSVRVLGIRFSMLKFRLDGSHHRILIFGLPYYTHDPRQIIESSRRVA